MCVLLWYWVGYMCKQEGVHSNVLHNILLFSTIRKDFLLAVIIMVNGLNGHFVVMQC